MVVAERVAGSQLSPTVLCLGLWGERAPWAPADPSRGPLGTWCASCGAIAQDPRDGGAELGPGFLD